MVKIKKYSEKEKRHILLIKILPVFILLAVCTLGIGYASMNAISLNIDGTLGASVQKGVFISSVVDELENEIVGFYNGTVLNSTIELGNDLSSTKTYRVTVYNNTNSAYEYSNTICDTSDPAFYSNGDITYAVSGILPEEVLSPHTSKTFDLVFKYDEEITQIESNALTSCIRFVFAEPIISLDLASTGGGRRFDLGSYDIDGANQTIFLELNVSSISDTAVNENIISIGQAISEWKVPNSIPGGVNLHMYYPSPDGKIIASLLIQGQNHIQFKKPYSKTGNNGIIKMAFNANGLFINGERIIDANGLGVGTELYDKQNAMPLEEYLQLFFGKWNNGELTVNIGSQEGTGRSNAIYNAAEIHKRGMTAEEMIELTKVETEKPLDQMEYTELITEAYNPQGEMFQFDVQNLNNFAFQTVFVEMDLTNISTTGTKENILSIGHDIAEWQPLMVRGVDMHFYYPDDDGSLILAVTLNAGGFMQWRIPMSVLNVQDGIMKMAVNTNGLYINGVRIINRSGANPNITRFSNTSGLNDINFLGQAFNRMTSGEYNMNIGSKQGDNRSTIDYNSVKVYEGLINVEDMINLTTN